MRNSIPSSVYRLQLNGDFPFARAIEVLPYLKELGVEGVYCSPFYDAYSAHGYDVTNPNALNPKLGTMDEYMSFCRELKRLGLKQIVDVVPNHMGFKGGKNAWWQDVLEKGPNSPYAHYFDINWNPEKQELKNKVLLPILGTDYGTALENGEITLRDNQLHYADFPLPLAAHSLPVDPDADLHELLEQQHYRLAYWRVANHEINYRRFFNIHELAAIRIEAEDVFEAHHKWLFELIDQGLVDGLRIDHPDGLYDPIAYFSRLKKRAPIYTVVEKILDREEQLPESWEVEGTVGYEALNVYNGVFIVTHNADTFSHIYHEFIGQVPNFADIVYHSKKLFSHYEMVSEVEALGLELDRLSETQLHYRDFTRHDLTQALSEVIACFPVYRSYIAPEGEVDRRDAAYLTEAITQAKKRAEHLDPTIFDFFEELLHAKLGFRDFILRFQQLTAPMMAKGLEDTAFYRYNRFISLNEVGGDPTHFGYSAEAFHEFNQEKRDKWPYGFIASSTHDTKRSEDVRQRLNVLSEIPERWRVEVNKWRGKGPSRNAEYLIFQLLISAWPIDPERLWGAVLKSLREAKEETSWMFPNQSFEQEAKEFLLALIDDQSFLPFQQEVARLGALNSLSATVLKLGAPGVIDIYQGNERLHFCLVDPDNRRPVPFAEGGVDEKFALTQKGLQFRAEHKELFLDGEYIPLEVRGEHKEHLIAYMRKHKNEGAIVIAARFFASLPKEWGNTEVVVPKGFSGVDIFTGQTVESFTADKVAPVSIIYGKN